MEDIQPGTKSTEWYERRIAELEASLDRATKAVQRGDANLLAEAARLIKMAVPHFSPHRQALAKIWLDAHERTKG